jgi:hypothetical protein
MGSYYFGEDSLDFMFGSKAGVISTVPNSIQELYEVAHRNDVAGLAE